MTANTGEAVLLFGSPRGRAGNGGEVKVELPGIFSQLICASLDFCLNETHQGLSACFCDHVCGCGECLGLAWEPFAGSCGVQPPSWDSEHRLASRAHSSVGIITSRASLTASLLGN